MTRLWSALLLGFLAAAPKPMGALEPAELQFHLGKVKQDQAAGQTDAAYRRLRWLLLMDGRSSKRSLAYLQTLQDLRNQKPMNVGASFALLPSTNLVRGSSQKYFFLDDDRFVPLGDPDEDRSGLGLNLSTSASYTHAYAPGREIFTRATLGAQLYSEEDINSASLRLQFGHSWLNGGADYTLAASYDFALYERAEGAEPLDWQALGIALTHGRKIGENDVLRMSFSLSHRQFQEDSRKIRDGVNASVTARYTHQLSPRNRLTFSGALSRANLESDSLSYVSGKVGARFDRREKSGFEWGIGGAYTLRDFDDSFSAVVSETRRDTIAEATLSLSHRDVTIWGQHPRLSCTLKDHHSNIALYDYDTVDCAISLRHEF